MALILTSATALFFFAFPAASQHLVGTAFNGSSLVQLVDVSPVTGAAAFIGASGTSAASISGQTAYDAAGNRYFFLGTPNAGVLSLYVVSTVDGTFTAGPLSGGPFNSVLDLEYDPTGDVLYGLLDVAAGAKRLGSIGMSGAGTGVVTLLGTGPFSSGAAISFSGLNKLDPTTNHEYFVAGSDLVGVDTALASPDVYGSGATVSFIQGLQADSNDGTLYALTMNGATSDRRLQQLSTTAGATFGTALVTGLDLNGGNPLSSNGAETFDSAGNLYYFLGTPNAGVLSLYAVNTPLLTLAAGFPKTLTGVTSVINLEFDPGTLPVSLQRFRAD